MSLCVFCKKNKKVSDHANAKYCKKCNEMIRLKKACPSATREDVLAIKKLAGKITTKQIAVEIGADKNKVKTIARQHKISLKSFAKHQKNPLRTKQVIDFYERYGLQEAKKQFPEIRVRSIIERYPHRRRQEKWQAKKIIEAVKMSGIVSPGEIAKRLARPRANAGSITSLFQKRLKIKPTYCNGLPFEMAKKIIKKEVAIKNRIKHDNSINIVPWFVIEKHIDKRASPIIKECVRAMASFQRWIHQAKNIDLSIKKIARGSK
jgi:hypothetical protein